MKIEFDGLEDLTEEERAMLPRWDGEKIVDGFGTVYDVVESKQLSPEDGRKAIKSISTDGISFVKAATKGDKNIMSFIEVSGMHINTGNIECVSEVYGDESHRRFSIGFVSRESLELSEKHYSRIIEAINPNKEG